MASWSPPTAGMGVTPDPKPARRYVASQRETVALREQFRHATCVSCGMAAQHLHHVAFRSEGGSDVPENLAPMCNSCHTRFHSRSDRWEHVAGHIRAYVWARASRLNYVLEVMGLERFDRRYPLPPFLAIGDLDRYRTPDPSLSEPESHGAQGDPETAVPLAVNETASGSESDEVEGYGWP